MRHNSDSSRKSDEAIAVLDKILRAEPKSIAALQLRALARSISAPRACGVACVCAEINPMPPASPTGMNGSPTPGTPAITEVTVPAPAGTEDPMQTYQAAYRDYQRGNYDLAIAGFRDFITRNPNSDLADNAAYWIGECLFSQKKYREAIKQFDTVVTRYPQSDKVAGALLKKGYSYISLGERAQGVVQLQYVIHEHPNTQEAALARQRLKQLGIER